MNSSTKRTAGTWVVCIALILGVVAWAVVSHIQSVPFTIEVAGKPIVTVESRAIAKKVLADVRVQGASVPSPGSTRFVESVTFSRAAGNAEVSDVPEAVRALGEVVSVEAQGWAVIVDDKPVLALTSKEDSEKALDLVKRFYEAKVKSLYSRSTFKESVSLDKRFVRIGKLLSSPEDAANALTTTSEKPQLHIVQRGDRAVHIATRYEITLSQLKSLNPGVDPNRITEGDTLVVRLPKLPITVVCKSLIIETASVTPPEGVRHGPKSGTRVSKMLVTYENGKRISEEIISQVTTWDRPAERRARSSRH